jgi:hypothetical protein
MNVRGLSAIRSYSRRRSKGAGSSFSLILLELCASSLSAQEAQPNSSAGFEGRNVANVEINLLALGKTAEDSATSSAPASLGAESGAAQGVGSQAGLKDLLASRN